MLNIAIVNRGCTTSWPSTSLSVIGRPSGCSASIARTSARTGLSSPVGSPVAARTASSSCGAPTIEYGRTTTGTGSDRSPSFRVLAMTPTIVTSAPRLTSISVPGGGCSSTPAEAGCRPDPAPPATAPRPLR